jgi:poly-gamma-glutamate synthesis protein (capsule biosynthesis protein)
MLDRHVKEKIDREGLSYLFSELATSSSGINLSDYEIIGANLEGAVTDNGSHYLPEMSYDFAFSPEIIKQLAGYHINFFNLANNHLSDQGERGIMETRDNLRNLGYFFSGCPDGLAGECSATVVNNGGEKVALAGFSMVYSQLDEAVVRRVVSELASTTDFVVVNIHWGTEYEHKFNQAQQNMAYALIDAGADVIIGHHPHVVQGIEIYRDKLIFYSLGNFIFDQYFSEDTQEGLAVEIELANDKVNYALLPLKSHLSQVRLISEKDKGAFLKSLIISSNISEFYQNQIIKNGKISIK